MTRFLLNVIIMLMLTSAPLMAGCQTMSQSEDARINAVIKSQLAEEHFDLTRVGVDTGNGQVYLSGVVPSSDQKARIEQIARTTLATSSVVNGSVINRLQVEPVVSDATITSSVNGLLTTDRMINASQIGVQTRQGIVSLNGVVPSQEQKQRAELLTQEIKGVRQVVNNLQVSMLTPTPSISSPIQNDPMITATIKEKLMADRVANLARVHVDTSEGIVYLNGAVPSTDHKLRAEQVARDVRGVIQVVNNLQVQP
jgi:hyperosmotically inducible protein